MELVSSKAGLHFAIPTYFRKETGEGKSFIIAVLGIVLVKEGIREIRNLEKEDLMKKYSREV